MSALGRKTTPALSIEAQSALEDALLHLELGDPVAQEPADAVRALEDRHQVAGAVELLGGREPGRAGANDRDLLAGARRPAARARPIPRRTRDR